MKKNAMVGNANSFLLMHKDVVVGRLVLNENGNIAYCDIRNKEHAPLGYYNSQYLFNWWERRAVPAHQRNKEILLDNKSNLKYMMQNLGLSLIDAYWIKPVNSTLSWKDVNLYEHNFAEVDFSYYDLENVSPFKPSATTAGELQKRWVIIGGDRYLVKGNYGSSFQQSINETVASEIHKRQGVDYTEYKLIDNLPMTIGGGLGCMSKNFTSENLEFIPAYDVSNSVKQKSDKSNYQHYIDTCVALGLDREYVTKELDYMILSDFIMTNTDRHYLNFGILRDPDTLEVKCLAPLFDTGNSMLFNIHIENYANIPVVSMCKTEREMLRQVTDYSVLDLSKLPTSEEIAKMYERDEYSAIYLKKVIPCYEKKIEILSDIQKGILNPKSKASWAKYFGLDYKDMNHHKKKADLELG